MERYMDTKLAGIWRLVERFCFTKPVDLDYGPDPEPFIADDEIIIRVPADCALDDACELVARARMSQDNPILGMYCFQGELSGQEGWAIRHFAAMTTPLQKAWTMKTKRRYAPEFYRHEADDMIVLWRMLNEHDAIRGKQDFEIAAEVFAILAEASLIDASGVSVYPGMEGYMRTLAALVHRDPDPALYIELINSLPVNYTVTIDPEDDVYDVRMNDAPPRRVSRDHAEMMI